MKSLGNIDLRSLISWGNQQNLLPMRNYRERF